MKNGFIRVAAATVETVPADIVGNLARIKEKMDRADAAGVSLLVFPELCLCGVTAMDLLSSSLLLQKAQDAVLSLKAYTRGRAMISVVGFPFLANGKIYNAAAVLADGRVLGIVPKSVPAVRGAFDEGRVFSPAPENAQKVFFGTEEIPFGKDLVFVHETLSFFRFGVEIGSDTACPVPPAAALCEGGAVLIARPCACEASYDALAAEEKLVLAASERFACTYIAADAFFSESTQDLVFSARHMVAECGNTVAISSPFAEKDMLVTEADADLCCAARTARGIFLEGGLPSPILFKMPVVTTALTRSIPKDPFLPEDPTGRDHALSHVLATQAHALARRIAHTHARAAVIGISGGLDSTLALLVAVRAYDILEKDRKEILAVTMPGFGTSERTYRNANAMCESLGVRLCEISIVPSVLQHFKDIGQDPALHDVTYENAQARERTQILMDLANKEGGFVIGTGDLSELALGWATYNGDHMSMYAVNASVTKTQVRALVQYEAARAEASLSAVLLDILETPVSPELLPTDQSGSIAQKTEDLVGPYELHDFFLYYTVKYGASPEKIYRMAKHSFAQVYDASTILKWLRVFTRRFFTQQFKRSCFPDGPKTGPISLSPRGAWMMPSDASCALWLSEIDRLEAEEL